MKSNRVFWGIIAILLLITVVVSFGTMSGFSQQNISENQYLEFDKEFNSSLFESTNSKKMENFVIKNDLEKYGIKVISPIDLNFDTVLAKYIGNNEQLFPLVNSSKPLILFIQNTSPKEIIGVSLRWTFNDSKRGILNVPQIEANPGVLMGIKPIDSSMVGKTSLINSNDVRFFCYFNMEIQQKVVNANVRVKNASVKFNSLNYKEIQEIAKFVEVQKNSIGDLLEISIDGIFFNDGTFAGEDKNFFFDSINGEIQARKDFLRELNEAKSLGQSESDFLTAFLAKIPERLSSPINNLSSGYADSNQAFDQSYQSTLFNLGREINIKRSSSLPDTNIIRRFQSVKESDFIKLHKLKRL